MKTFRRHFFSFLLLTTLFGCGSTIVVYDQYACSRVTSLKVDAPELADGSLSKDDFEYHVRSRRDLLSLVALKQAGISKVKTDKFRNDVFTIVTSGILEDAGLS